MQGGRVPRLLESESYGAVGESQSEVELLIVPGEEEGLLRLVSQLLIDPAEGV